MSLDHGTYDVAYVVTKDGEVYALAQTIAYAKHIVSEAPVEWVREDLPENRIRLTTVNAGPLASFAIQGPYISRWKP